MVIAVTSTSPPARTVCTAALCVLLTLSLVPGVAAADQRTGGSVVVGSDETIEGNLDIFGGSVVVRGTVTGDLNVFAGSVRIEGTVEGDVSASAGTVVLGPNATVGGNLDAAAGTVTVAGTVDGNVDAAAETITLAPTAAVGGDLTYGGQLVREDGAQVSGSVTQGELAGGGAAGPVPSAPGWVVGVYGLLVNAALGAVLLLVFPQFSRSLAARARNSPLRSGGTGLLVLIGVPVVLVLVALTIVGIPLTLAGTFAFVFVLWVAAVYGRYAVGAWLSRLVGVENRWAGLLVGLVAVAVLKQVPFLSGLVEFLVLLLGLGALSLTLYGRYRGGDEAEADAPTTGDEDVAPA